MSSIEDGYKRKQAKQGQVDKQQAPTLDLEIVRKAVQEAVAESIQDNMRSLRDLVHHNLSAELGAIDAQLETMRHEMQFIRTATDLLIKASQAQALANEDQINYEAQSLPTEVSIQRPIARTRRHEEGTADKGPTPIVLEAPRLEVKR